MNYTNVLDFFLNNPWFTLFGAMTLIQIVPIKINPWGWIFKKIKKCFIGDVEEKVDSLEKMIINEKIENKRWNVLDFANSCHQGRKHTKEEWAHCLKELSWYESYCSDNGIPNGEITECSKYLRGLYQRILDGHKFLKETLDNEDGSSE